MAEDWQAVARSGKSLDWQDDLVYRADKTVVRQT
jgi:hypothetical protein